MKKKLSILAILLIGVLVLSEFVLATVTSNMYTIDNHPPGLPRITGPTYMSPGEKEWKFEAVDPDGDNVSYQIDWGDGNFESWFDWYASGEEITMSHYYQGYGSFRLMARAKDIYNATGEWAGISIVVSKNDHTTNFVILRFFSQVMERFLR